MNKKIVYVAQYVTHYHADMFQALNNKCRENGDDFYLISVKTPPKVGRTGITGKVIENHLFYNKDFDIYIRNFHIYWQDGVLKLLKGIKPDKIIFQGHVGCLTSWIASRKYKNKVYTWQCGYEYRKSKIKDVLQKIYLHGFVHHLAYHTQAKIFTMKYGISEEDITVLHNTINQKKLKTASMDEARSFLKNNYNIPYEKKILLYVGTLLEEKKVDILIKMMDLMDDSYLLIVVGEGPFRPSLETIAGNKVVFVGAQMKEKHYFFTAADIFFMPGTGGLALNEAMYYGNVLFSSLGDGSATDLVIENFNGKRIDGLSVKNLASLVNDLYDTGKIIDFKENAKTMIDRFSFESFIDKFIKTINNTGLLK